MPTILDYLDALQADGVLGVNRIVSSLPRPEGLDAAIVFEAPAEPSTATEFYAASGMVARVLHLVAE